MRIACSIAIEVCCARTTDWRCQALPKHEKPEIDLPSFFSRKRATASIDADVSYGLGDACTNSGSNSGNHARRHEMTVHSGPEMDGLSLSLSLSIMHYMKTQCFSGCHIVINCLLWSTVSKLNCRSSVSWKSKRPKFGNFLNMFNYGCGSNCCCNWYVVRTNPPLLDLTIVQPMIALTLCIRVERSRSQQILLAAIICHPMWCTCVLPVWLPWSSRQDSSAKETWRYPNQWWEPLTIICGKSHAKLVSMCKNRRCDEASLALTNSQIALQQQLGTYPHDSPSQG